MKKVKCFGCGKMVHVSRSGNLLSHLNGAERCLFVGQPAFNVEAWNNIPTDFNPPRQALADRYKRKSK